MGSLVRIEHTCGTLWVVDRQHELSILLRFLYAPGCQDHSRPGRTIVKTVGLSRLTTAVGASSVSYARRSRCRRWAKRLRSPRVPPTNARSSGSSVKNRRSSSSS